jgi:ribonucleotide monophosphatase NagD (HAD superfamily)
MVGSAFADTWKRAELYFTYWNVLTRARLTITAARESAQYKKTFTTNAPQIAEILALHKLKSVKEKDPEDARLVVDLYTDTNQKITYYASRFRLSSEDDSMKRNLDNNFQITIQKLFK